MDVSQLCTSSEIVQPLAVLPGAQRVETDNSLVARIKPERPILPPITDGQSDYHRYLPHIAMSPTFVNNQSPSRPHYGKSDLQQVIDRVSLLCEDLSRCRTEKASDMLERMSLNAHGILESLQLIEAGKRTAGEEGEMVDEEAIEYDMIRQARNLQDDRARPKYRRRSKRSMIGQRCHSCNTNETPEWRRGPDGARTLCNACGLHYSKLLRKGSITVQGHHFLTGGESARGSLPSPGQSHLTPPLPPPPFHYSDTLSDHPSPTARSHHDR